MMKKFSVSLFILLFTLGLYPAMASSQDLYVDNQGNLVQRMGKGRINWSSRTIEAVGNSDPNQPAYGRRRAAEVVARRNLLAVLTEVSIDSITLVKNGINEGDIIKEKVEGVLRHSWVGEPRVLSNGGYEVIAYKKISEDLSREILTPGIMVKINQHQTQPYSSPAPAPVEPENYTGLIIDAIGKGARPALVPRIQVEGDLRELYGPQIADPEQALVDGFTGFASSVERARTLPRVGSNPLVIKAKEVAGRNHADIIISKDDAVRVFSASLKNNFLKERKVVIVMD